MASKFDELLSQAMTHHRRTRDIIDEAARTAKTPEDCRRLLGFFKQVMDEGIYLSCLKGPKIREKIGNLEGSEKNEVRS